jgi:hypothetical protein
MTKTTKCLVVVGALALGAACGKKADDSGTSDTATPPTGPVPTGGTPQAGDIARYPDEIPMGGTKKTLVSFTIHQAADGNSPVVSRVGPGTFINLKASKSSWMLIEYPSGVGQLSPGWINLDRHDASKVQDAKDIDAGVAKDAGAPDTGAPDAGAKDAGAPADAGAAKTDSGRGTIKIRPVVPKPG